MNMQQKTSSTNPQCRGMKSKLTWLFLAIWLSVGIAPAEAGQRVVLECIIGVVNNEVILWSEWRQKFFAIKDKVLANIMADDAKKKREKTLRVEILQRMLDDVLLDQVARKMQIAVSTRDVNAAINDTRKKYNLTPKQFREAQGQQGFSIASYRSMVTRELRKLRLLRRVLRNKVSVTLQDQKAFYRQMISDVKTGPPEFLVRHILVGVPQGAKAAVIEATKKKAEALIKIIKKAMKSAKKPPFVSLVKKYSQEPNVSDTGGSLGWHKTQFGKGEEETLPSRVMQAVRQTKVGTIFPRLLKTVQGFHILYVEQRRLAGILSFKEALPNIRKVLQKRAFEKAFKIYIVDLRKKAVIDLRMNCANPKK